MLKLFILLLLGLLLCLPHGTQALLCDSGDLSSVCIISSVKEYQSQTIEITGKSLVITEQGTLSCPTATCSFQVTLDISLSVSGQILGGLINITSPSITIGEKGTVSATGMGLSLGPGTGGINEGGSYGGWSSYSSCSNLIANKKTYGSAKSPMEFGSGNIGVNGGGVVLISTQQLEINGDIAADGANGISSNGSAGSGGSIWISSTLITGNGSVTAEGGDAFSYSGGSGGRIAISGIPETLTISAAGGLSGDSCSIGGYGTIYDSSTDTLFIFGVASEYAHVGESVIASDSFNHIAITNNAVVNIGLVSCNSMEISDHSLIFGNCLDCSIFVYVAANVTIDDDSKIVMPSQELFISADNIYISGSISAKVVSLSANSLSVCGSISADYYGYPANTGPGAGFNGAVNGGGGSYGGFSVLSCLSNNISSGTPYGSIISPTDFGSGGGNTDGWFGGAGGGIINITVTNELQLLGDISANGEDGAGAAGGGSGGTVLVRAEYISGSGAITADGGVPKYSGGGLGSGGRIAITGTLASTISISAAGKSSYGCTTKLTAGAGTVYLAQSNTVRVDNFISGTNGTRSYANGITPITSDFGGNIFANNSVVISAQDNIIKSTSLILSNGATFTCGTCIVEGEVTASSAISIDATSQFILGSWWDISTPLFTVEGIIFGSGIVLTVGKLNVSGGINTNGNGFGSGLGPGAGSSDTSGNPGGGAGHGANGMQACGIAVGGSSYDNHANPTVFGSGGGNSGSLVGGAGGGVILIRSAEFCLSGYLSANGLDGISDQQIIYNYNNESFANALSHSGSGGGSGGSINVRSTFMTLESTAVFAANGGNGGISQLSGGGGAGGYVFLNVTQLANYTVRPKATVTGGTTECKSTTHDGRKVYTCNPGSSSSAQNIFICAACSSGSFSSDGLECKLCSPGSKSTTTGATSCIECLPGTYQSYSGSTYCTNCPSQTYSDSNGAISCTPCVSGSVSYSGSINCTLCGPGTYSDTTYHVCYSCSSGTYSNKTANSVCSYCSAGYHQNLYGQSNCTACSLGSYNPYTGRTYCYYCSAGTFTNASGSTVCPDCPTGSYSPNTGASTCLNCSTARYPGFSYCPTSTGVSTGNHSTMGSTITTGRYTSYYNTFTSYYNTYTTSGSSSSSDTIPPIDAFFIIITTIALFMAFFGCCVYQCKQIQRRRYESIPDEVPPPNNQQPQQIQQQQSNQHRPIRPRVASPSREAMNPHPLPPQQQQQSNYPPIPPPKPYNNNNNNNNNNNEPDARNQECVICCDAKRETVMLPCGHITACEMCTRTLLNTKPQCPICRKPIASFVRMFSA